MKRLSRILAISGVLLVLAPMVAAQTDSQNLGSKTNILITVRMGTIENGKKIPTKSYSLIVASGTMGSKLLAGQRVPFPATAGEAAAEADGARRIVYQNVGFVTEMKAWVMDKQKIKLVADIEDSRIAAGKPGEPPSVETRQLAVNAILTDGVPLELTRMDGVTDQAGFVEVEAKILH